MRKFLTIALLLLFTVTQTEFGQLLRLPLLAEHFYKHRQQDGTSLIAFLKEHYTREHHDDDAAEDNQLPFKSSFSQPAAFMLVPAAPDAQQPVCSLTTKRYLLNDPEVRPRPVYGIFHPPRAFIS